MTAVGAWRAQAGRTTTLIMAVLAAFQISPIASAQSETDKQVAPYGAFVPDAETFAPLEAGPFVVDSAVAEAQTVTLENDSLQSEFLADTPPDPPETPGWLKAGLEFIGDILIALGPLFKVLLLAGAGFVVLAILAVILRELIGFELPFKRKKAEEDEIDIGYRPAEIHARTLLDDADKLAAEGRFDEAARLLLTRSIQDIESERDVSIPQSLTSREISRIDLIPGNAKPAFILIAQIVESAIFAGRGLDQAGFAQARNAYQSFALPEVWQ